MQAAAHPTDDEHQSRCNSKHSTHGHFLEWELDRSPEQFHPKPAGEPYRVPDSLPGNEAALSHGQVHRPAMRVGFSRIRKLGKAIYSGELGCDGRTAFSEGSTIQRQAWTTT
jgi:hypothetical protein